MESRALRRRALGVGLLAMLASSPGQTYMVSAFHGAWTAELGLSKTLLGTWYAAGSLAASSCLVVVGRFSDRYGPRTALAFVALALGVGCGVISMAESGVALALGFFLIRLFGQGSMGLVGGHAVALAFDEGLGRAEGLRVSAISVAVGVAPGIAVASIAAIGWRATYVALGMAVILIVVPASRLLPKPAAAPIQAPLPTKSTDASLHTAIRTRAYAAIGLAVGLHAAAVTAVHFHSQPLFAAAGFSGPSSAARGMSLFAICMFLASLFGGWLVDRLRWGMPFALSSLLLAVSMVLLMGHWGSSGMFAGMVLLGLAQGLGGVAIVPSVTRCFGRAHFGVVRGSLATLTVAGASLGPIVLGFAADHLGGFSPGLLVFALACVPAGLMSLLFLRESSKGS